MARMPLRLQSPAMVPLSSSQNAAGASMNPHAAEFAPRHAAPPSLLPSSTAAASAGDASSSQTQQERGAGAGGAKAAHTSMREMVRAAVYMPRRTLNRVTLTRNVACADAPNRVGDSGANGHAGSGDAGAAAAAGGLDDHPPSVLHKFRDVWKLHYLPRGDRWASKSDAYDPMVVATIDDIRTFWQVFNNLPTPHEKKQGTYYFFRDDIDPKWEHEANQGGGMLRAPVGEGRVDEAWELLLLRAVGASWSSADVRRLVNGVVVKMREKQAYTLELWVTKDSEELRRDLEELWNRELGGWFELSYVPFHTAATASVSSSGGGHTGGGSHSHSHPSKNQNKMNTHQYNNNNNNSGSGPYSHFRSSAHDGKKNKKVNPFSR